MPNGHGGIPYFGGPIFYTIMFAFFALLPFGNEGWLAWMRVGICLALALVIGWRVAYHIHLYNVDDYGGAYTPPEIYQRARRRYRIAAPLYSTIAVIAGCVILWWRGLL